jgi:hypothetical protein
VCSSDLTTLALLAWIVAATAIGQAVGWAVEGVRRLPGGVWVVRAGVAVVLLAGVALQWTDSLADLLGGRLAVWWVGLSTGGWSAGWAGAVLLTGVVAVVAVLVGIVPATWTAHLPARAELKVESGSFRSRPTPDSDLRMLVRFDRGSVWRAVPIRRGLMVLAVGPGLVGLVGGLPWAQIVILPGLVASGAILLFGVNMWAIEARGVLWRESLPVSERLVWAARTWVMVEFIALASTATVLIAALRSGLPGVGELAALLSVWVVVLVMVTVAGLRWSMRSPYAVDLRSARATPAPPVAMVGYSSRLALVMTLVGLLFSGMAQIHLWWPSVVLAAPMVAWSGWRGWRAWRRWLDPVERARVVMTVAG